MSTPINPGDSAIADLKERRQRAREAQDHHMGNAKASLKRLGYDIVPRTRRAGRIIGYIGLAALGALTTAAFIGAVGLAVWLTRWLVGML